MSHQEISSLSGGIWKGLPEFLVLAHPKFIGHLTDKYNRQFLSQGQECGHGRSRRQRKTKAESGGREARDIQLAS